MKIMTKKKNKFCGTIQIVGKTNVGKSTLFNKLLEKNISIISNRKNTTEKCIIGVKNYNNYQYIFIDTPGVSKIKKFNINKYYTKNINVDLIIFIVNKNIWNKEDEKILNKIKKNKIPVLLLINKIDKIKNKKILLPFLSFLNKKFNFFKLIPVSIIKNEFILYLKKIIKKILPRKEHIFKKRNITYNTKKFLISEMIREKFIYYLQKELPYAIKIKTIHIKNIKLNQLKILAEIIVKNFRHKKIVIGKNGNMIKKCNMKSRVNIENFFKKKVHLYLNVKCI
ncbi:GTPase Era [Buchnera aphidicola (Ceratoglyphina bambusae)]|uniref:GTPase Era n=1 Tax=Buchnera aphidicola TaxID=9 RepID=UPI0031B864EA